MTGKRSIQQIDIAEFRTAGYLQEVNRRLLHPLGVAIEATIVDDEGWSPDKRARQPARPRAR